MKILVTGGTGFLGQPIVQYFRDKGHEVRTVSRSRVNPNRMYLIDLIDSKSNYFPPEQHYILDLSSEVLVRRMFAHWQPDTIIHLAANPMNKLDELAPTAILDDNIKATQNLLHWCPKGTHFMLASSVIVYGDPKVLEIPEGPMVLPCKEDDVKNPKSIYAITKLASEYLVQCYNEYRDIKYKIFRLCATVGPNLTHGVIKDFMHKLKENDKLEMLGNYPGSYKPYLHISDVINAFDHFLESDDNITLNICNEDFISIDKLADTVMSAMGVEKDKVWLGNDANWKGDNPVLSASCKRAFGHGWEPKLSSIEAVALCVKEQNEN